MTTGDLDPAKPARAKLLAHQRQASILDELRRQGSLQVAAFSARLGVSEMTIRRDLVELEREGRLARIHGGAVALEPLPPVVMDSDEPSFEARLRRGRAAKEAIAAKAAELVEPCRTIALDVGTTTFLLAGRLDRLPHAQIFTNSLRVAERLADGLPEVSVAGGRVRALERSVGGPTALAQFGALWFDVAVLGVSGVTTEGLFDYSIEDTEMKRVFLRRSATRILLCDAEKFRRMSLVQVGRLADISVLVTDAAPPPDLQAALSAAAVEIVVAPPVGES